MSDRQIRTAADADQIYESVESVYDGWYAGASRIDWEDFVDRLEGHGWDLGDDMLSEAIKRIREIVRDLRKEEG